MSRPPAFDRPARVLAQLAARVIIEPPGARVKKKKMKKPVAKVGPFHELFFLENAPCHFINWK